jgi:tripartite-type tricarboxylate transporter receptor subunit TctC
LASLPDVPTISETVIPGFNYSLWGGYFVPKDTPTDIVQRLNKDINALLAKEDIRKRLEADGASVKQNTPQEFQAFVDQEIAKYRKLIDTLHITIG